MKLFVLSCHYYVTNIYIYGSLLNPENRRSDGRKNRALLCALDGKKLVKAVNHGLLFIKEKGKLVKDLIDFGVFREENRKGVFRDENVEGIDVPFFHLVCILVATDSFSDANKLGQGGFGSVYKVISIALIGS
jgi:hypothetical protein